MACYFSSRVSWKCTKKHYCLARYFFFKLILVMKATFRVFSLNNFTIKLIKANYNLGNNILAIYSISAATLGKFLKITKLSEYKPSRKFNVNSFELHQERVDKRESWAIEATKRLSLFEESYLLVVDKWINPRVGRYLCSGPGTYSRFIISVCRNESLKHYSHLTQRVYKQRPLYDECHRDECINATQTWKC